ncbi:MAG: type II toxin-antitoxin system VapC family toxin [Bacteroidota bacterium]
MKRLLVDTNIMLDLLAKREAFYESAAQLFSLADQKEVELYMCSLSFANAHYILSRQLDEDKVREILRKLKVLVNVVALDSKTLDKSLNAEFKDFEDALQYYSALAAHVDIIVTRNLKDFKKSNIPVMTARQYMEMSRRQGSY